MALDAAAVSVAESRRRPVLQASSLLPSLPHASRLQTASLYLPHIFCFLYTCSTVYNSGTTVARKSASCLRHWPKVSTVLPPIASPPMHLAAVSPTQRFPTNSICISLMPLITPSNRPHNRRIRPRRRRHRHLRVPASPAMGRSVASQDRYCPALAWG